jgi:hypothetical protein
MNPAKSRLTGIALHRIFDNDFIPTRQGFEVFMKQVQQKYKRNKTDGENMKNTNDSEKNSTKAQTEIDRIDEPFMNDFRELLKRYMKYLSTDISEIAQGLDLSRPLITDFINGDRNHLPLSPGRVCYLYQTLIQTESLCKKRRFLNTEKNIKEARIEATKNREQLKKNGADELLIAAGFQPERLKMVPTSIQQYPQLSFLSFLYEGRPLSQEVFSHIIKKQMDRLVNDENDSNKSTKKNPQVGVYTPNEVLKRKLIESPWITQNKKIAIDAEYNKIIELAEKKEEDLTPSEIAGLFKSVMNNQLVTREGDVEINIARIDRVPLSLVWTVQEDDLANDLLEKIHEIGDICEKDLSSKQSKTLISDYPITKTTVKIIYDKEEIVFECVSKGTPVSTAISSVAQNMGFRHVISTLKVDMTWLGRDVRSLINTVVTMGDSNSYNELTSGESVSSDLLQSLLQALVIAGKKWVHKKLDSDFSASDYKSIIKMNAKLRADFYKIRLRFDQYDFDDNPTDVREFDDIDKKAEQYLTQYESYNPKQILNTFIYNFRRISILSKLYQLHHWNVQVDHDNCIRLIEEIENILSLGKQPESEREGFLIPSMIYLVVEKIAYNLSFGTPFVKRSEGQYEEEMINYLLTNNLLEIKELGDIFERIDNIIEENIKKYVERDSCSNDLGYDIYHSLGSYHSIVGRVLFYIGENRHDLNSAFDRFLKAAYYFQKIGLSRKVQRSLTLAGRVKVRIKDKKVVRQCEELSDHLLKESATTFTMFNDSNFISSIDSRLNLLRGRRSLIIDRNREECFRYCLKSLKGSLWLGLNRHIVDIIYTISECVEGLGDEEIREIFKSLLPEIWQCTELSDMYKLLIRGKSNNKNEIVKGVINELFKGKEQSLSQGKISETLRKASANIWNEWYWKAIGRKEGEHPLALKIVSGKFLQEIDEL